MINRERLLEQKKLQEDAELHRRRESEYRTESLFPEQQQLLEAFSEHLMARYKLLEAETQWMKRRAQRYDPDDDEEMYSMVAEAQIALEYLINADARRLPELCDRAECTVSDAPVAVVKQPNTQEFEYGQMTGYEQKMFALRPGEAVFGTLVDFEVISVPPADRAYGLFAASEEEFEAQKDTYSWGLCAVLKHAHAEYNGQIDQTFDHDGMSVLVPIIYAPVRLAKVFRRQEQQYEPEPVVRESIFDMNRSIDGKQLGEHINDLENDLTYNGKASSRQARREAVGRLNELLGLSDGSETEDVSNETTILLSARSAYEVNDTEAPHTISNEVAVFAGIDVVEIKAECKWMVVYIFNILNTDHGVEEVVAIPPHAITKAPGVA